MVRDQGGLKTLTEREQRLQGEHRNHEQDTNDAALRGRLMVMPQVCEDVREGNDDCSDCAGPSKIDCTHLHVYLYLERS